MVEESTWFNVDEEAKMSRNPPSQADKSCIQMTKAGKDDSGFASRIQSSADGVLHRAEEARFHGKHL